MWLNKKAKTCDRFPPRDKATQGNSRKIPSEYLNIFSNGEISNLINRAYKK